MRIITQPPAYTAADAARREEILARLDSIARVYHAAAQPLTDELARIDARYPPRVTILHDPQAGPAPHILEG